MSGSQQVERLSWSLVIPTMNREKILPIALRLAAEQSRPPRQIIVIDASSHWEPTRRKILAELAAQHPQIEWIYQPAEHRSSSLQRNQGLEYVDADVIFFFDDDTLMYPACAEEIMRVYESDPTCQIAGVMAASEASPPAIEIDDIAKTVGQVEPSSASSRRWASLRSWIRDQLLLMNAASMFIPYDGPLRYDRRFFISGEMFPVPLMQGYRMTFRTEPVKRERFEPLLRAYAAGEDLDLSYRVSRHGALVEITRARVHHFQSGSGRLGRFVVTRIGVLNQALMIRRNAADLTAAKRAFHRLMCRRVVAEAIKDTLSRRASLPQVRGVLAGWRKSRAIFGVTSEQLRPDASWYAELVDPAS